MTIALQNKSDSKQMDGTVAPVGMTSGRAFERAMEAEKNANECLDRFSRKSWETLFEKWLTMALKLEREGK
jgi:hypothetical protein